MSEEGEVVETPLDEIEQEARTLGWVPKELFRGDEKRWVDAKTFVERGHVVLPIVQENNKRLQGDLGRANAELRSLAASLKAAQAAIAALESSREEDVKEQVAAARRELKTQLKAAKTAGDIDAEVELTEQLGQLNEAAKPRVETPPPPH